MSNQPLSNAQLLEIKRKEKEREELKQAELEKQMFSMAKLSEMTGYNEQLLTIIQKNVAKETTPAEFAYFLSICKEQQLNPINKEIWCYKDLKGNVIIFTGRDGFLKRNKMMPTYRGMKTMEVCQYDDFVLDAVENKVVKHEITNNRGPVIGAYCYVYHEGVEPTFVYLDFDEFNLGQAKWKSAPKMMLKKCAQSHALKEAAGMTGIQAEEGWNLKNGVATQIKEDETQDISHEEIRLEELINSAKDLPSLEKHLQHCETPALINLYNKKKQELMIDQLQNEKDWTQR